MPREVVTVRTQNAVRLSKQALEFKPLGQSDLGRSTNNCDRGVIGAGDQAWCCTAYDGRAVRAGGSGVLTRTHRVHEEEPTCGRSALPSAHVSP